MRLDMIMLIGDESMPEPKNKRYHTYSGSWLENETRDGVECRVFETRKPVPVSVLKHVKCIELPKSKTNPKGLVLPMLDYRISSNPDARTLIYVRNL